MKLSNIFTNRTVKRNTFNKLNKGSKFNPSMPLLDTSTLSPSIVAQEVKKIIDNSLLEDDRYVR